MNVDPLVIVRVTPESIVYGPKTPPFADAPLSGNEIDVSSEVGFWKKRDA